MASWREDIGDIRELITGTPSETWRVDLLVIARSSGHTPQSWREAIGAWADDYGVSPLSWRNDLIGIAQALGSPTPLSWREALGYIRLHYDESPVELYGLSDSEGYLLGDKDGNKLMVRS